MWGHKESGEYFYYGYTRIDEHSAEKAKQDYDLKILKSFQSNLSKIDLPDDKNPLVLFRLWLQDVQDRTTFLYAHTMNLSTVSKRGRVSSRNVVLTDLLNDAFHFTSSKFSQKSRDIAIHPQVALTFMWFYTNEEKLISRQIRIEGRAVEKDAAYTRADFDNASLANKFRKCLSHQSSEVDWMRLKKRHDDLLDKVRTNEVQLEMPDHNIAYKVIPDRIEFHHTNDAGSIPDRVLYTKQHNHYWRRVHLEP